MAVTYKGVNYTNLVATIPSLTEQGQLGGYNRHMYDTFVLTADLAASDIIKMGPLIPEGAILDNCTWTSGALGGSCTVDVGWAASSEVSMTGGESIQAANATGFFSALPVSSAVVATAHGSTYEGGGGPEVGVSSFYKVRITSPIQVQIAEHAVSSGATGRQVSLDVSYIVD